MWPSDDFSNCPKCGELTYPFDRHFPDPLEQPHEAHFPVLAYYCLVCDHVVVEAFHSRTDRDVFICPRDADGRFAVPVAPPHPHPAYDCDRISSSAISGTKKVFQRSVRQQIGRIVRPDDPDVDMQIPTPVDFDVEQVRTTLDKWLRNSKSGRASRTTVDGSHVTIHLTISNRPRVKVQLERLRRRFQIPKSTKFYNFNEGRKYEANDLGSL